MSHVLLVEDDVLLAELLLLQLGEELPEANIDHVASAEEAMKKVQEKCPKVIIMDGHLGATRGADLVKALRKKGFNGVIIAASHSSKENRAMCEAGANYVSRKEGEDLALALRRELGF